jgi:ribosomal protein S18 acetylase RimI-like enzyme
VNTQALPFTGPFPGLFAAHHVGDHRMIQSGLFFRQAAGDVDVDAALAVLDVAAERLAQRGVEQWPATFGRVGWRADSLREEASKGHVYLAKMAGFSGVVGTVTVTDWADEAFADAWPSGTEGALYVIRLASAVTGREVGSRLLEFAKRLAAQRGARVLRLDCAKHNPELHQYYTRQGFTRVGIVDLAHRKSGALFEHVLSPSELGEAPH